MRVNRSFSLGVAILSFVLLASAATQAFDGNRKGFVAGFGGGIAPVIHWVNEGSDADFDETGFGFNLLLGYAWDDRNVIAYEGIGWAYPVAGSSSEYVFQALDGIRWYHYYGKRARRVFTSVGIGWVVGGTDMSEISISGIGYTVGVGYEFLKQLQIGVYYTGAHTSSHSDISDDFEVKTDRSILTVLVTLVAY